MSTASSNNTLGVAVSGASGRMGRMLIEAIQQAEGCRLTGALDAAGSSALGQDAGAALGLATGVSISSDATQALANSQVLIDFTRPEATMAYLAVCREKKVNLVIGTTGFTPEQKAEIGAAARDIAIMMAPNMSVGVNVVLKLLDQAARALDEGYDVEIIETHHRNKIDAPSGTALKMGEVVAAATGRTLETHAVYGRHGITGVRDARSIGFSAIRGGDVVGDHTVLFAGLGERIEITHKSSSRATYAQGSVRAARFLADKTSGLYSMDDVLGAL